MKFAAGEKKLGALCAVAIALPLGVAAFFGHINAPPIVNFPARPVAPAPNGYDFYVAAGRALVPATPPVDPILDAAPPLDAQARARRYSLARKTAWLQTNKTALAQFARAQTTPSVSAPLPPLGPKFSNKELYDIARAKRVETYARRAQGDWNGALQSGLDGVQMGHDIRRGAGLLHFIMGARWGDYGRLDVGDLVDRLDAAQAKAAARRLEKLVQTRWSLEQILAGQKVEMWNQLLRTFETVDANDQSWRGSLVAERSTPPAPVRALLISRQGIIDGIDAEFDRQSANARLPYAQKGAPAQPSGLFFDDLSAQAAQWRYENARDLAGDQLLLLQLALRAYHLENGAYPRELAALTPRYLSAIPADPFGNGELVRYRIAGANYVLWSIGPDERDDGGTPIGWSKDEIPKRPALG